MNLGRHVKREPYLSNKEKKSLIITSVTLAVIIFMFFWRTNNYSLTSGIFSLLVLLIISFVSMLLFVFGAKMLALKKGYQATYTHWRNGLLVGFVLSFISYGLLPLILPGNIEIKTIDRLRHGKAFFGENKKDMFLILSAAPLTSLLVSFLFFYLFIFTHIKIFYYGMFLNVVLAFFSLLPLMNNIGSTIYFARRRAYFGLVGITLLYFVLVISRSVVPLLVLLLLVLFYWVIILIKKRKK